MHKVMWFDHNYKRKKKKGHLEKSGEEQHFIATHTKKELNVIDLERVNKSDLNGV